MATQALRNGLSSPVRAAMRPILKRPAPLALSPVFQSSPLSTSVLSPSQRSLKSPHVRFPASPSKLVATIATYSPRWGERVYSPSSEGFRLSPAPKVFRSFSMAYQPSPAIAEFEDPRSPKLQPAADVTGAKAAKAVRLARNKPAPLQSIPQDEGSSAYPRSPYPTSTFTKEVDVEMETRGRQMPRTANQISGSARAHARNQSIQARQTKRNIKGLTLESESSPAAAFFTPIPSPLGQTFIPAPSVRGPSLKRANKPTPLPLEVRSAGSDHLSNAFWNSMSIENQSADEPMMTAPEYPESAVEASQQPSLMFAGADGVLFSPGLPKPHTKRVERLRETLQSAMMSPNPKRSSFQPIARKEITAPSPNDPFAAFPSFGAALAMAGVAAPPAAVQRV